MPKIHVTDDGPKPCGAQPGNCPLKGAEHFEGPTAWTEAAKSFEAKQGDQVAPPQKKAKAAPRTKSREEELAGKDISSLIKPRLEYAVLRGKSLNEMEQNLDADYRKLLKTERMDENGYRARVDKYIQMNDNLDDAEYYNVDSVDTKDGTVSITLESRAFDFAKDDVIGENYVADLEDGEVVEHHQRGKVYGATRTYEIPQEAREAIDNHYKLKQVEMLRDRMNNPDYPNWSALPTQTSLKHRRAFKVDEIANRTAQQRSADILAEKARDAEEDLKRVTAQNRRYRNKLAEVESLNKERKDLNRAMSTLGQGDAADRARESMKKERDELDARIEKSSKTLENYAKTGNNERMKQAEKNAERAKTAVELYNNRAEARQREYFVKDLAQHYPSEDPQESLKAAEEWADSHPDAVKRYRNGLFR